MKTCILPKFISPVDNKLYRGRSISCPYRLYTLKQNGITQIVDLRNNFSVRKVMEKMFCKILGIKYINQRYPHRLNNLPSKDFLKETCDIISKNEQNTYLQCLKGKRRTGIVTAFYEKFYTKKSDEEILDNLCKKGFNEININTKKGKKYLNILTEFIDTYLPNLK